MKPNPAQFLCAAVAVAVVMSAPAAAQTNGSSGSVKHWPMRPYHNPDGTFKRLNGEIESENWAGYAVTAGSPYTSASATWQIPSVTDDGVTSDTEYVLNWVGIGGFADQTLVQLGTESGGPEHRRNLLLRLVRAVSGRYRICVSKR
jgi:hypothetical protein